jgi:hypothetical protein
MQKLRKDLEATQQAIAIQKTISKQREATLGKKGNRVQTRKKKFRPLGGKDDWKRL